MLLEVYIPEPSKVGCTLSDKLKGLTPNRPHSISSLTMSSQQVASEPQVTVKIPCRVGWKLLQEYDNSGNKHTTITRSVKVTQYKEIAGKDYTKVVNESSREAAQK